MLPLLQVVGIRLSTYARSGFESKFTLGSYDSTVKLWDLRYAYFDILSDTIFKLYILMYDNNMMVHYPLSVQRML